MVLENSDKTKPKVSVVIAAYNGEKFIRSAIQSVLTQTFAEFEIVVVNDGSTDRTADVLREIADSRLRVLHNDRNRGISYTRNRAFAAARGDFIAILDCDDVAKSTRLAEQLDFLSENPDHAMVAAWAEYIDSDGRKIRDRPVWELHLHANEVPPMLLFENFIFHSSVMLRACMCPRPAYRDLEPSEDYDLWVRLADQHKISVLAKPLVQYRTHGSNVSKVRSSDQKEACRKIVHDQLNRLGVGFSVEELALHHEMFWSAGFRNRQTLIEIRRWLEKLRNTNEQTQVFEVSALQQVIKYQWLKACKRACKQNILLLSFCLLSRHAQGYRLAFLRESLRAILKRLRRGPF